MLKKCLLIFAGVLLCSATLKAQEFSVNVEGGVAAFTRNDVRIPNEGGTRFDMLNLIGEEARPYFRIKTGIQLGAKHQVFLLYAPLQVSGRGFLSQNTFFEADQFSAEEEVKGTYRFSNYRLSYRYTFLENDKWELGVGATAFIRDAKVQLEQGGLKEKNTDLGFVPLLHLFAGYSLNEQFQLVLDGEGLLGAQGRAFDAALMLNYRAFDNWSFQGGYRILEGGADVDEVFNFATAQFFFAGLSFAF